MRMRFDALSASQGATSLGLITSFAFAGSIVLAEPRDLPLAIGTALLILAAIYLVAMLAMGRVARRGGCLDHRFNFQAGSRGASGFCIVGIFACSGILTLKDLWQNTTALGVSLLIISGGCTIGMIWFGLMDCSSGDDQQPGHSPVNDEANNPDLAQDGKDGT